MLKMTVNSNATNQMKALMNKVDTFPNRIASAQQSALFRTADNLAKDLYNRFPASRYLDYEIGTSGRLGFTLTITPRKGERTSTGADSYIAAAVLLKGRKAYRVRGKRGNMMILRSESVPPYPKALRTANIPRMQGRGEEIKSEARQLIIKNLEYAIKRFGFDQRGGSSGLEDLPFIRTRAGGR